MSKLIRCPACGGTKKIRGMGLIEKKCEECKGIGWIEQDEVNESENDKDYEIAEVKSYKKRGRKPKAK